MGAPVLLRSDFDADALRREARRSHDGAQALRLLALAAIYDDSPRSEAVKIRAVPERCDSLGIERSRCAAWGQLRVRCS